MAGRRLPGGDDAVTGFNKGGTVEVAGIKVTMTRADHSAGDWNPGGETTLYLGEPAGFVIELENGFRIYDAGDTDVFGDMRLIGELYRPDIALLPIGGHFTMGPREAALAVELLGVKHVMPIHYGTFPLLAGTPAELAVRAGRARPRRRRDPRPGAGRVGDLDRWCGTAPFTRAPAGGRDIAFARSVGGHSAHEGPPSPPRAHRGRRRSRSLAIAIPVLGADPSPSAVPPGQAKPDKSPNPNRPDKAEKKAQKKAAQKAAKTPEIDVTVEGTVQQSTDGQGRPTFTLTAGGTTWELSAGPAWYWGAKNPLAAYVGKSVTVAGSHDEGSTELDVATVDGTAIRAAGKPPWAGGPWVVGRRTRAGRPGWPTASRARGIGQAEAPGQNKDETPGS